MNNEPIKFHSDRLEVCPRIDSSTALDAAYCWLDNAAASVSVMAQDLGEGSPIIGQSRMAGMLYGVMYQLELVEAFIRAAQKSSK